MHTVTRLSALAALLVPLLALPLAPGCSGAPATTLGALAPDASTGNVEAGPGQDAGGLDVDAGGPASGADATVEGGADGGAGDAGELGPEGGDAASSGTDASDAGADAESFTWYCAANLGGTFAIGDFCPPEDGGADSGLGVEEISNTISGVACGVIPVDDGQDVDGGIWACPSTATSPCPVSTFGYELPDGGYYTAPPGMYCSTYAVTPGLADGGQWFQGISVHVCGPDGGCELGACYVERPGSGNPGVCGLHP